MASVEAQAAVCIDGIFENELRGRVLGVDGTELPDIYVSEGDIRLGAATPMRPVGGSSPECTFRWKIPPTLFDRRAHVLYVHTPDAAAKIAFLGDPALLIPAASAVKASAPAVAPASPSSPSSLDVLRKQTSTLQQLLNGEASGPGRMARRAPLDIAERYGSRFADATMKRPGGQDFIWLGVINYNFRIQRPQHLVTEFADAGNRIFYISINFEAADDAGRFRIEDMPHHGVFLVRLRVAGAPPRNIYAGFTEAQVADIQQSLDEALLLLNVTQPVVVVQYPSWHNVAAGIPGATVVHDCLDYVGGFSNVPQEMVDLEKRLILDADLVVTTAAPLADHVGELRESTIIRNAADVDFFATAARFDLVRPPDKRPVVGYFGAIADWYEIQWIKSCAMARPEWDFVLIGQTVGADVEPLQGMPNVKLLGEQPYSSLPAFLAEFDVAVIPFIVNDLIRCTNPVKLYEYMAAGKPVVASPMPEVVNATPLVYIAHDALEFEEQIAKALAEDSAELRRRRHEWAAEHTWTNRARSFLSEMQKLSPRVSVVVLAYNNWTYTQACLHSVLTLSDYPNLEVILVDNASTDETLEELERFERRDQRVRVIRNEENLGFAAGNNVGIVASTGDYVILLNNDTYVTRGWVRDLIRPLMQDPDLGLVGPLTNNIGNEQKINIHYSDMQQMASVSRRFTRRRLRQRFPTENLAFFCVALSRKTIDRVGLLDEAYGRGFFEDDDYCQRVSAAGMKIAVADDVFVHHHLSASFNALGSEEKAAQMERNKAIYESRWGAWKPHVYRDAIGFG